ncbi:serine/threonine-protein kinase [Candidatus Margulisiibacteriota bacterium]
MPRAPRVNRIKSYAQEAYRNTLNIKNRLLQAGDRAFTRAFGQVPLPGLVPAALGPEVTAADLNLHMTGEDSRIWMQPDLLSFQEVTADNGQTYRVVRKFAEGGQAAIFEVRDEDGAMFLLKQIIVPEGMAKSFVPEFLSRFDREINVISEIKHRNVVKYIARDPSPNPRFFIMEHVNRGDLDSLLQEGRQFNPRQAVQIVGQTVNGLIGFERAARGGRIIGLKNPQEGVAHRDLKPENLLVDEGEHTDPQTGQPYLTVKLSDFGIVKIPESQSTSIGMFLGSPAPWTAPELMPDKSRFANQSSDIFALGGILHYALVGKIPFENDLKPFFNDPWELNTYFLANAQALIAKMAKAGPPRENIPQLAWDTMLKAMSFDPARRPQTYIQFRNLLLECLKPSEA